MKLKFILAVVCTFVFAACRTRPNSSSVKGYEHASGTLHCKDTNAIVTCKDGSQELVSRKDYNSQKYCEDFGAPQWMHSGQSGAVLTSIYGRSRQEWTTCKLQKNQSARIVDYRPEGNGDTWEVTLKMGAIKGCMLTKVYVKREDVHIGASTPGGRRPYHNNKVRPVSSPFTCKNVIFGRYGQLYLSYD